MTAVTVNLFAASVTPAPHAVVLQGTGNYQFAVVRFGHGSEVILPGRDLSTAVYLRQLAASCEHAADVIAAAAAKQLEQEQEAIA